MAPRFGTFWLSPIRIFRREFQCGEYFVSECTRVPLAAVASIGCIRNFNQFSREKSKIFRHLGHPKTTLYFDAGDMKIYRSDRTIPIEICGSEWTAPVVAIRSPQANQSFLDIGNPYVGFGKFRENRKESFCAESFQNKIHSCSFLLIYTHLSLHSFLKPSRESR